MEEKSVITTVLEGEKKPKQLAWWMSLILGVGLLMVGIAHFYQENYDQASLDFAGAFGTLGLPALTKKGYRIEIRKDIRVDTAVPPGFSGVGRLTDSNEDIDCDPLVPPKRKYGSGAEVRRADEHE